MLDVRASVRGDYAIVGLLSPDRLRSLQEAMGYEYRRPNAVGMEYGARRLPSFNGAFRTSARVSTKTERITRADVE